MAAAAAASPKHGAHRKSHAAADEEDVTRSAEYKAFHARVRASAMHVLRVAMPEKIVKLQKVLAALKPFQASAVAAQVAAAAKAARTGASDSGDNDGRAAAHAHARAEAKRGRKRARPDGAAASSASTGGDAGAEEEAGHLSDSSNASGSSGSSVDDDRAATRRAELSVASPANEQIVSLGRSVQEELRDALSNLSVLKVFIQLRVPPMEDGNNFGVEVQEDTLGELGKAEETLVATQDLFVKYFNARGRLMGKIIKHPGVLDYQQCVSDLDEKEHLRLHMALLDLRNIYASLHDVITKNIDKLEHPRGASKHVTMI